MATLELYVTHLDRVHDFSCVVPDSELFVPVFAVTLGEVRIRLELGVEVVEVAGVISPRYVALKNKDNRSQH